MVLWVKQKTKTHKNHNRKKPNNNKKKNNNKPVKQITLKFEKNPTKNQLRSRHGPPWYRNTRYTAYNICTV
jgi:hypothetical protein